LILVDTSVWIDHLREGIDELSNVLANNEVYCHMMVVGELALGHLKNRAECLKQWRRLPIVITAKHHEVMYLIDKHQLMGMGIGFVDAHLLAACKMNPTCKLWTRDKPLLRAANKAGIVTMS
jgi:predicted nucleic acid-binding protein